MTFKDRFCSTHKAEWEVMAAAHKDPAGHPEWFQWMDRMSACQECQEIQAVMEGHASVEEYHAATDAMFEEINATVEHVHEILTEIKDPNTRTKTLLLFGIDGTVFDALSAEDQELAVIDALQRLRTIIPDNQ